MDDSWTEHSMAQAGTITQLPSGSWQVKVTIPATRTEPSRRASGTAPTQAAAKQLRREMLADVQALGDRAQEVLRPRANTLLRDYISTAFSATLQADVAAHQIRPRTQEDYLKICALRINPLFGHRKVSTLLPSDADLLAAQITSRGLASSTARRAVVTLIRIMRTAERDQILPRGTADAVRLPSGQPATDPDRVTPDEARLMIKTFLADAHASRAADAPLAALIMTYTGLRRSESLGIRHCDVDLEAQTARIRLGVTELATGRIVVDDTKSKFSHRVLHLPASVIGLIDLSGEPQDRICGTRPSNLSRYVSNSGLRALNRPVGCHELRRGYADLAKDAGIDDLTISRSLGHSDLRLLHSTYAGRREERVLEAGAAVSDLLG